MALVVTTLTKTAQEKHEENLGLADYHGNNKRIFHADKAVERFMQQYDAREGVDPFRVLEDPTFSGFRIFFHFSANSGLLADEQYTNSALAYLRRIGDTRRYELLRVFIGTLSRMNSEAPWIFESISGLQELYAASPFEIYHMDKSLTINCYETIDYRMSALNMMWRDICFDRNRKVWVLPYNLRTFSMSVYIFDLRVFNTRFNFLRLATTNQVNNVQEQDIATINHIMFDVGNCTFMDSSGSDQYSEMSNSSAGDMQMSSLMIKYEDSDISGLFRSITGDEELSGVAFELAAAAVNNRPLWEPDFDNTFNPSESPEFTQEGFFKNQVSQLRDQILSDAVGQASNRLQNLLADNIAGLRLGDSIASNAPSLRLDTRSL